MTKATCSNCKSQTFVNPKAQAARLAKFGSQEAIDAGWKCRKCSQEGKPVKAKKTAPTEPQVAPEDQVIDVTEPVAEADGSPTVEADGGGQA